MGLSLQEILIGQTLQEARAQLFFDGFSIEELYEIAINWVKKDLVDLCYVEPIKNDKQLLANMLADIYYNNGKMRPKGEE